MSADCSVATTYLLCCQSSNNSHHLASNGKGIPRPYQSEYAEVTWILYANIVKDPKPSRH